MTPVATGSETMATLNNYKTGETIRAATIAEYEASKAAAETDGGAGVIVVDGVSCYVDGEITVTILDLTSEEKHTVSANAPVLRTLRLRDTTSETSTAIGAEDAGYTVPGEDWDGLTVSSIVDGEVGYVWDAETGVWYLSQVVADNDVRAVYEVQIEGEDGHTIRAASDADAWDQAGEIVRGGDWTGTDSGPVKVYLRDADGDLIGTRMIETA